MRLTDLMSRSRSSTSKVCGFMWFKYSNCLRRAWWSTDMSSHGGGGDRENTQMWKVYFYKEVHY